MNPEKRETKEQSLEDQGILYVSGAIDEKKSEELCKQIIECNMKTLDCIQLIINSPGGQVHAGFAILDMMAWSRLPVRTTGLGMVASMGLLILMAGDKGHRVITPRTSLLSHRYSAWRFGKHSELIAHRKEEDLLHERVLDHYRRHSHLKDTAEVEKHLLRDVDTWLTAEEAVKFGLVDIVEAPRR